MSCNSPAGATAANPINPASKPNLPLAATNSSSSSTSVGTSAVLLTEYVRARTSEIKASGNNATELIRGIIATIVMHRKKLTIKTVNLLPPGTRSITGPINGAITANGARLIAKNKRTLLRAASGLIDKKSESARAIANDASPHAMSA